ncbi:MAG TPA: response regulator [Chitinophagales bacterium]|nr:response regulator [Chitinophagales bacterium]
MKILVVDDERDIEQLYIQRFRKEIRSGEITILFAFSGSEALELMSHLHPMDVVLLLSDINMPGMTGFDLLKVAKEKYPYITIFMVSAYGDESNAGKAKTLGADDFFTKPVDFKLLRQKIFSQSPADSQNPADN